MEAPSDHVDDFDIEDNCKGERKLVTDMKNPEMNKGCVYTNMEVFRLAMRQYAINKEFELGIDKTDRRRYIGFCKGAKCNWRIWA